MRRLEPLLASSSTLFIECISQAPPTVLGMMTVSAESYALRMTACLAASRTTFNINFWSF